MLRNREGNIAIRGLQIIMLALLIFSIGLSMTILVFMISSSIGYNGDGINFVVSNSLYGD